MIRRLGKNKKGFTLAELLIVVAIVAILVAIAIPTFTAALDKARLSADAANVRAAYSEAVVAYLESNGATTTDSEDIKDAATQGSAVDFGTTTPDEITITGPGSSGVISFAYDDEVLS